jgi:predicted DNA-binding transcriptional regulator AlpA
MRAKELIEDPMIEDEIPAAILILAGQLLKRRTDSDDVESDRLLSLEDAVRKLRVSKSWLYRRTETLPFIVRTGRKLSFSERGIEEYIRKKQNGGGRS